MTRLLIGSAVVFWSTALSFAQISVPRPGFVRLQNGSIHAVVGVPGNLLVSPAIIGLADAASFSDAGSLTANQGLLTLRRADGTILAEFPSNEPHPLLDIGGTLTSAAAWLPSQHTLLHWNGSAFESTQIEDSVFGGVITSLQIAGTSQAVFNVSHTDGEVSQARVELASGNFLGSTLLPGAHGKAFLQHGWVLSQNLNGFDLESPTLRKTIRLTEAPLAPGDVLVERMSSNWLHVWSRSMGLHWAILFSDSKFSITQIAPPAEVSK